MYLKASTSAVDSPQTIGTDTDSTGRFSVQAEPGSYRLWVERPGYARQSYGSLTPLGPGSLLTLAPSQQIRDIEIKLTPLGAIAGVVYDEDGDPLQGVSIQVLRFSYSTGYRQLTAVGGASSDDRGYYRVYDLPSGRYLLLATPRGTPLLTPAETAALFPQTQELFAALYYPGVLDAASASEVALAEGAEVTGIAFRLPRVRSVRVRGRLLTPIDDLAGSELQVVLARRDGDTVSPISRTTATLDQAGHFEFANVAPGSYWLVASQHHHGRILGGRMPLEVSATAALDNLTIPLTPAVAIEGRVETEDGSASLATIGLRLSSADRLASGPAPTGRVAADGSVHLAGVTPGIWDLALDPLPEGFWVKLAKYGDIDVLPEPMNIMPGPPRALRIVLASNGAQISGMVVGTGESSRTTVVLAPAAEDLRRFSSMYRSVSARDQGIFVFKDVRPGSYKLFAFQEVEPFAWLDPEVLKLVDSLGETVNVAAGERVERRLAVIPPEALLPEH
jgi:hypothetical protein